MKVFICYAHKDLQEFRVADIAQELEKYPDIERVYYWERDCTASESIVLYMEQSITQSDVIISISSHNSRESGPVQQEIDMAVYLNKQIVPIFKDINDIRMSLRPKRGVQFLEPNFNKFIEDLYAILTGKLSEGEQDISTEEVSEKTIQETSHVESEDPLASLEKEPITNIDFPRLKQDITGRYIAEFKYKNERHYMNTTFFQKDDKLVGICADRFGFSTFHGNLIHHPKGVIVYFVKLYHTGSFKDKSFTFQGNLELVEDKNINKLRIIGTWMNQFDESERDDFWVDLDEKTVRKSEKPKKCEGALAQYSREFPFNVEFVEDQEMVAGYISDNFGNAMFTGVLNRDEKKMKFLKSYFAGSSAGALFYYTGIFLPNENKIIGEWIYSNGIFGDKFWMKLPEE